LPYRQSSRYDALTTTVFTAHIALLDAFENENRRLRQENEPLRYNSGNYHIAKKVIE